MEKLRFQFARNAVIVIGSIATATVLRAVIDAVLHEPIQYTTFYLAVMVSALYGGLYWGLVSTVLSAVAATFWLPPLGQPLITETSDLAEMSLFLIVSALIAWMSDRMRQQQHLRGTGRGRTSSLARRRAGRPSRGRTLEPRQRRFSGRGFPRAADAAAIDSGLVTIAPRIRHGRRGNITSDRLDRTQREDSESIDQRPVGS